jgi:hypothetical protein
MNDFLKIPNSWDELTELKDYLSDCDPTFLRLPEDKLFYILYRDLVPREIALEIIKRQIGEQNVAIVKNNFPYSNILQHLPNVIHYCLWSKKGKLTEEEIKREINQRFPNNIWFYSERKVNYKSVPEIWHCHIFLDHSLDYS